MFNPQHKVTSLNYSDIEANKCGVKAAIKQSPKKSSFSKENIITISSSLAYRRLEKHHWRISPLPLSPNTRTFFLYSV
jgi:hypothetical protein